MIEGQPDDEAMVAALATVTAAQVTALRQAAARVRRRMAAAPLVTWPQPAGDGSAEHPLELPHPDFDSSVSDLIGALADAHACPAYDWMSWAGADRLRTGEEVAAASLADVLRLITAIVRGERFSDGTIAAALDSGVLLAAVDRVIAAQVTSELSDEPVTNDQRPDRRFRRSGL